MTSYNPGIKVRSPGPKIPDGRRAHVARVAEFAARTSFSASIYTSADGANVDFIGM